VIACKTLCTEYSYAKQVYVLRLVESTIEINSALVRKLSLLLLLLLLPPPLLLLRFALLSTIASIPAIRDEF
jgi:hypothetical protein